jgi:tetratricopeptide (TPR) repeat protein
MGIESVITLQITMESTPSHNAFHYHILQDGRVIASNQSLSQTDTEAVYDVSRRYAMLFELFDTPALSNKAQEQLGKKLFKLWLATTWDKIKIPAGFRRILVIASDMPDVLNLPWELMLPPDGDFLGVNPLFSIRRQPNMKELSKFNGDYRARPLRLLFMACAPLDQNPLDYDFEEDSLLKVISGDVIFDSCDMGTFDELRQKVTQLQPHVIHLTGHGFIGKMCPKCKELNDPSDLSCRICTASLTGIKAHGYFAFEDETGNADWRSSKEIGRRLAGSGVQCAFISGCQTGEAPLGEAVAGICQGLVSKEIPFAIGWAAPIADTLATQFAHIFYEALAAPRDVDYALNQARQFIWDICIKQGDPSWTLPVLYSATDQGLIFDPDLRKPAELPARATIVQQPLPGMTEGFAEHFVGRRREQQKILPALRNGTIQALILTGIGGSGKSSLATKIALKLKAEGYNLIPISSSRDYPLNAASLLDACRVAFYQAAAKYSAIGDETKSRRLEAECHILDNPKLAVEARLKNIVATLNNDQFLLILDNFESNMDENSRTILDQELAVFYSYLLVNLSGYSRVIITSRYLPADQNNQLPKVKEYQLEDISEAEFIKILRRDEVVDQRFRSKELPLGLFQRLYRTFGGTPRFLLQMRNVIREMKPNDLEAELSSMKIPEDAEEGVLQKIRDKYFESIFIPRLYRYLSPNSQKALSKAAVFDIAINLNGLAVVTGEAKEKLVSIVREWQDRAFIYMEIEKEYSEPRKLAVYGLLRGWLLNQLGSDERKQAHQAAGDFLQAVEKHDKGKSLGLNWGLLLFENRNQYILAGNFDQARLLTDKISRLLEVRGLFDIILSLNKELFEFDKHPSTMTWIGRSCSELCDYDGAREWYQKGLDAAKDDPIERSIALQGLASIDIAEGNYKEAQKKLICALEIRRESGKEEDEADIWSQLGVIDLNNKNFPEAMEEFNRSLHIRRKFGKESRVPNCLYHLAIINDELGNKDEADKLLKEALEICLQIGDRHTESVIYYELADRCLEQGDLINASSNLLKALNVLQQLIGDIAGEAAIWHRMAVLLKKQGKMDDSIKFLAISYYLNDKIGHEKKEHSKRSLLKAASQLEYSQEQLNEIIQECANSYQRDKGRSLLEAILIKA